MVRAVEQIEKEIAALDQAVNTIAQTFYETYQQYLSALGKAVRQQLVLAGYHICTHSYPEQFLKLSPSQRQELQRMLQQQAKQGQTTLGSCLQPILPVESIELVEHDTDQELLIVSTSVNLQPDLPQLDAQTSDLQSLELQDLDLRNFDLDRSRLDQNLEQMPAADTIPELTLPRTEAETALPELTLPQVDLHSETETTEFDPNQNTPNLEASSPDRPLHPSDIVIWQTKIEEEVVDTLQNVSHQTNLLLQQANILSSHLPEPVLEVAAKADLTSESASPPNLLSLLVEADSEAEKPVMTPITAVRLRLSEIEFGDAATATHRSSIRQLMSQLTKLGRDYQRKKKEYAVVQAESAWRSSWFEVEE